MAAKQPRSSGRRDVYREITEKILDSLEAGTVPWRRPWRDFGMQCNYSSGRPYRGINRLLTQQARAYSTRRDLIGNSIKQLQSTFQAAYDFGLEPEELWEASQGSPRYPTPVQ